MQIPGWGFALIFTEWILLGDCIGKNGYFTMFFNSVLFGHRVYLFCSQMSERDQTAGGKWVKYNIGYY